MSARSHLKKFIRQLDLRTTVFIGLGNPDRGDDNFGLELANRLRLLGVPHIFSESDPLDDLILTLRDNAVIQTVIFLDAINQGLRPGTPILLRSSQFPPQTQSHAIPLGVYAVVLESSGKTVYCLGVQPAQIGFQATFSTEIQDALTLLVTLFSELTKGPMSRVEGS